MALNIVIPLAGRGQRFKDKGYTMPKPLIPLHDGRPMIHHVMDNVKPHRLHRYILIAQTEQLMSPLLGLPSATIVGVPRVTDGAACTVLLAKHLIDNDDELLIVNSDQLIDWSPGGIDAFLEWSSGEGAIAVFKSDGPQYSYVRTEAGLVREVAEKKVISNLATAGVYYWHKGRDFVRAAEAMIAADDRHNGEFYVCPTYNYAIARGLRIDTWPVGMQPLGTPEDLERYLDAHK